MTETEDRDEDRDGFTQTGTHKMLCCKRGCSGEKLSRLWLSVCEFQDLPIQFWQVLKAKNFNRCHITVLRRMGKKCIMQHALLVLFS